MLMSPWGAGVHRAVPGPAAPSSCSFLLMREADENINFTEQRPPLQSSQRAGSTEKCWVQLNSNQNQIGFKTREKGMFPVLGTPGRAWTPGSLWEPQPGMNTERFPVSQGSPMLSGRRANQCRHLARCHTKHPHWPGQCQAHARVWWGSAVGGWELVTSLLWGSAGPGLGCLA